MTGVWNGGSSPHQPFQGSSSQSPRWGLNLLRPMISTPMPSFQCLGERLGARAAPPPVFAVHRAEGVGAPKNQFIRRPLACPKGASTDFYQASAHQAI